MKGRLPSTRSLAGFEAAARHLSFTAAAAELNLTQGAISRQIRELEDLLGVMLFRRSVRRITLTPKGEEYLAAVAPLLAELRRCSERLTAKPAARRTMTISVLPTLATIWLMPRLHLFSQEHPEIEVRIVSSIEPADDLDRPGRVAIRVGLLPGERRASRQPRIDIKMVSDWDDISADPLFPDILTPVCSRSLLGDRPIPSTAAEVARYPLIYTSTRRFAWADWFASQNAPMPDDRDSGHMEFGHFFMSLEAARRGQGIALLPHILINEEKGDASLVTLRTPEITSSGYYYLLIHASNRQDPDIDRFRTWICSQAKRFQTPTPGRSGDPVSAP